jgi:hypothetical protein
MDNIIVRFVVLLVDTHYHTSTALAMFRYNCDAIDFVTTQRSLMSGSSNIRFTIEALEPGLHTVQTSPTPATAEEIMHCNAYSDPIDS